MTILFWVLKGQLRSEVNRQVEELLREFRSNADLWEKIGSLAARNRRNQSKSFRPLVSLYPVVQLFSPGGMSLVLGLRSMFRRNMVRRI